MRLRLIWKIALFTNLVIVAVMTFFAYVNVKNLENALMKGVITDVDKLSETMIRSAYHHMLESDLPRVHQMIREIGTQKGIEVIRLINKNGRISYSTRENEFGLFLDKKAEACTMCHGDDGEPRTHASTMNSSRLFTNHQGVKVLGLAKAIYNEESCYTATCHFHPESIRILGVLDVVVSLDSMHEIISEYRNKIIALTIFLVVVISLSLSLLAQKFINHPVRLLLNHTELLARGELDQEVEVNSGDELGELAVSFNSMTGNLRKAREELEDWGRNLEMKVEQRTLEIKQMQGHLIRSEKLASMGELVAGIAHEINNPLTGMLIYASLVRKDTRLHPELQNDLDLIIQETERSAKIVKGLLNFARESAPQMAPVSLNKIIEISLALIGNQSFFHNIVVKRELADDLPLAHVDPQQVEQVLINILINAGQAMTAGGTITITTGSTRDGQHVLVRIRDTGCGIPEENLARIFDPFFSTKESGTGLGLSLCYGIVENNRGKIDVESILGEGTSFTVSFPIPMDDGQGRRREA
jgi:two-component system NtrC family sensor kinase